MASSSKPKMSSIDSCIILRMILQDNAEQYKMALDLLMSGETFSVDAVAIMEAVHVMAREHIPRAIIGDGLQAFLANQMISYDQEFFAPIFRKYLAYPSLSFDDCVLEARSELKGHVPLWTFDRKFARQSETARLLTY